MRPIWVFVCVVDDYKDDNDDGNDYDNDDKDEDDDDGGEKPKNDERSKFLFFSREGERK